MPENTDFTKPSIDDQFWFDISAGAVKNAIKSIDTASTTVQTFIKWLLSTYIGTATIGSFVSGSVKNEWVVVSITITSILFIIAYWFATKVQLPVITSFDARSPDLIRDAYSKTLSRKKEKLNIAVIFSLLASISVAFSIGVESWGKYSESDASYDMIITKSIVNDIYTVGISGQFPKSTEIDIKLKRISDRIDTIKYHAKVYSTKEGVVQFSFQLKNDFNIDSSVVVTEWIVKDQANKNLSRKF